MKTIGQHHRGTQAGISLAELTIVVAMIGVISAMAIPRIGNSIARHRADSAARRIAAEIEFARRQAITASAAQAVALYGGKDSGLTFSGLAHPDHPARAFALSFDSDCEGVTLISDNFGADREFVFDIYGVPDATAQLVIGAGAHRRTILVDARSGRTSVTE